MSEYGKHTCPTSEKHKKVIFFSYWKLEKTTFVYSRKLKNTLFLDFCNGKKYFSEFWRLRKHIFQGIQITAKNSYFWVAVAVSGTLLYTSDTTWLCPWTKTRNAPTGRPPTQPPFHETVGPLCPVSTKPKQGTNGSGRFDSWIWPTGITLSYSWKIWQWTLKLQALPWLSVPAHCVAVLAEHSDCGTWLTLPLQLPLAKLQAFAWLESLHTSKCHICFGYVLPSTDQLALAWSIGVSILQAHAAQHWST